MESNVKNAAAAIVAPTLLKNFKLRWVVYGAAAYFGLRYLNKRGILPKQTGAALDLIGQGVDVVRQRVGIGESNQASAIRH